VFDRILPYYNNELRFMREMAKEFAAANPKIAGRLRLSGDAVEDPHVSRLIEAFSFINARLRMKLDDEFPELSESLLGLLYPHYLAPMPSLSIVEMTPQSSLGAMMTVPARSKVTTEAVGGETAEFRTGYDVELWPIEIAHASLCGLPLAAPPNRRAAAATSALRLTLRCLNPNQTFVDLGVDRLRFYIHGEARTAQILYELILGGCLSIALADTAVDEKAVILERSAIRAVGLNRQEVLLPMEAGSEPGYVMLSEYFAFPEKFLFFDITGLSAKTLMHAGSTLEIFLYFDRYDPALEGVVTAQDFRLFCTPIINLFSMKADPIRLDPSRFDYRIVPDARRETSLEVYGVEQVVVSDRAGARLPFQPFYSLGRRQEGREAIRRFWHATRRYATHASGGDDVFIAFVDEGGAPAGDRDHVASIDILATNRNFPERLPFGNGRPSLLLQAPKTGVKHCVCLFAPSHALRPRRGQGALWRLISHLSLNHLSVADEGMAVDVIKEMLSLYDHADAAGSRAVIERLVGASTAPSIARSPGGGRIAFTSGTDITLDFDDRRLSGTGTFMLGSVLEAVLASLSGVNGFTRTRLRLKGEKTVWQAWDARSGTQQLI
jgi:type VI secretion system protein ImpG